MGECSAGTIGARVIDSVGYVYALSNNHVYALENTASIGSDVLQPGRYDTNCAIDPNDIIGQLSDFEPWSLRELVLNGEIPCVKFRTKVLIDRRDLGDWIEANKETGVF